MKKIRWLNMSKRIVLHSLKLYNKIIYQNCPNYLYQKIKFRYDAHALDLRHKFPPPHKTILCLKGLLVTKSPLFIIKCQAILNMLRPSNLENKFVSF